MWGAISQDLPSPRTRLLVNIDDRSGYSALRFGRYKYVNGKCWKTCWKTDIWNTVVMFSARDETSCQKATLYKANWSRLSWYFSVLYTKCRLGVQIPRCVAAIYLVLTHVNAKNTTNYSHCSAPSSCWITTELFYGPSLHPLHFPTLYLASNILPLTVGWAEAVWQYSEPKIFFHFLRVYH